MGEILLEEKKNCVQALEGIASLPSNLSSSIMPLCCSTKSLSEEQYYKFNVTGSFGLYRPFCKSTVIMDDLIELRKLNRPTGHRLSMLSVVKEMSAWVLRVDQQKRCLNSQLSDQKCGWKMRNPHGDVFWVDVEAGLATEDGVARTGSFMRQCSVEALSNNQNLAMDLLCALF
ncbi:hypothetical protein LguiA_003871 [Lonicera macranthoides]